MESSGSQNRTLSSNWIVIPTYWGDAGVGVYDHPTPVNGNSTLPRLLDSLLKQDTPLAFEILILLSTTSDEYEAKAKVCLLEILSPYEKKLNLFLADSKTSCFINEEPAFLRLDLGISTMRGYASVRNMQLLIPAIMGAENIIAIDDDEVLPKHYFEQATKWIGKDYQGNKVLGLAGPYLDQEGSPYISEVEKVENILVHKSVFINQTICSLMESQEELPKTPMALGGNMVFNRELFTQVGFDPAITRGEDIDYLINARIEGHYFYFDPKLTITHLPPRHFEAPEYAKMKQDVIRFIYEQEKLRTNNLSPKKFLPYPGRLFDNDLLLSAEKALQDIATPEMISIFGSPEHIISEAEAYAKEYAPRYSSFSKQWKEAMKILDTPELKRKTRSMIQL